MNKDYMKLALFLAQIAKRQDEVPVGCVLVDNKDNLISVAYNSVVRNNDPSAHAEIIAIREACRKLKTTKLINFSMYVTLEPCLMCESLILSVGIKKIYFGTYSDNLRIHSKKLKNYFSGVKDYEFLGGFKEKECRKLIIDSFKEKR